MGVHASACLRDTLDEKAVQWSSVVVEARLIEVSERIELKSLVGKIAAEAGGGEVRAAYWYRLYSFEVERLLDGNKDAIKPRHRLEVVRIFGKVEGAATRATTRAASHIDHCGGMINRGAIGNRFVLLLRRESELKIRPPPVWADPKNTDVRDGELHLHKAYAVIHALERPKATDAQIAELEKLITTTRAAEKKVSDAQIKKLVEAFAAGKGEAADELKNIGYKAIAPVKSARDKKETPPATKQRLAKLASELSPTPISIEMNPATD
jgi:hypothetical protein